MIDHFINGVTVDEGGYPSDLFNPSNGSKIGTVLNGGADELDMAVQAAHAAFQNWSTTGLVLPSKFTVSLPEKGYGAP